MGDEPERIALERSGGFVNVTLRADLPTEALTPHERAGVDALLRRPAAQGAIAGAPDRYQYDLTVRSGARQHHVRLGEHEIDERLRPLIQRLEDIAASER